MVEWTRLYFNSAYVDVRYMSFDTVEHRVLIA